MVTVSYTEQKTNTDVTEKVTEKEIIDLIKKNNHISTTEIAEKLSVTIKSKGLIERVKSCSIKNLLCIYVQHLYMNFLRFFICNNNFWIVIFYFQQIPKFSMYRFLL